MHQDWPGEVVVHVSRACAARKEGRSLWEALRVILVAAISVCDGESGSIESPLCERSRGGRSVEVSLPGASGVVPPACLAQVLRTGKSMGPPSRDGGAESDEPCNGFGPVCAMPLASSRGLIGTLGVRLSGRPALDGARWEALRAICGVAAAVLDSIADAAVTDEMRAHEAKIAEFEAEARRRREERLGDLPAGDPFSGIVGCSEATLNLLEYTALVARTNLSILLTGEPGVGKEKFGRAVHKCSGRKGAWCARNAAGMPESLLNSELFGHVAGAFTGAKETRKGAFRMADGGTLLLDEIGDAPPEVQARLLRALQEKEVQPTGSDEVFKVDTRVICATNRDLDELCREGKFRLDLKSRIKQACLHISPLRDRPEEIPHLVRQHLGPRWRIEESAMRRLLMHEYRAGNVRELFGLLDVAKALSSDGKISDATIARVFESQGNSPLPCPPGIADAIADAARANRRLIVVCMEGAGGDPKKAGAWLGLTADGFVKKSKRNGFNWLRRKKSRKPDPPSA